MTKRRTRIPSRLLDEAPASTVLIVGAIMFLVLALSAYYAYNGGWKTEAAREYEWLHVNKPLTAASHGDPRQLQAENALRAKNGKAPLAMPNFATDDWGTRGQKVQALREKALAAMQRKGGQ